MTKKSGHGFHDPKWHPANRFWMKIQVADACWIWLGKPRSDGYGIFSIGNGRLTYAHRFAYELLVGPIPKGLQIDHLCRNRICVNPDHLEAVTPKENVLRGESPMAKSARRDSCQRGHAYTNENTLRLSTRQGRVCRACKRELQKRHYWKRKQAS